MMRKFLALLVISPLFCALETRAQTPESKLAPLEKLSPPERQQRLYEAAKGEGEAIVYANMDVSAMKPLTDGFMKRYPGAKAASVHFSGASIITRIETEARAHARQGQIAGKPAPRRPGRAHAEYLRYREKIPNHRQSLPGNIRRRKII